MAKTYQKIIPWQNRFWTKIIKTDNCWEWQGGLDSSGYGQIAMDGRRTGKSHRLSWILSNGEVPKGLQVLHHCDNRKCCRPEHLFLGTIADNMADKVSKGRQYRRLSNSDVFRIRFLSECCKVSSHRIAKVFRINQAWAWRIISRKVRLSCS